MGIAEFSRTCPGEDNAQTRRLSNYRMFVDGPYYWGNDAPSVSESALEEAKLNLSAFSFVGLQEEFGRDIRALARKFDLVLPARIEGRLIAPETLEVDADELAAIREANRFDLQLYEFAQGLVRARLSERTARDAEVAA